MRFMETRFVCALALGIVACGTAAAQVTPEQQSAMRANCRSDFMSKCRGVSPGGKEALTCLQKNVETLSSGCKSVVSSTLPKPAPVATAPAAPAAARTPPAAPASAAKVEPPAAPAPTAQATAPSPPPVVPPPAVAAQPAAKPPTPPKPAAAVKPPAPKVAKPAPPKPALPASQPASAPAAPDVAGGPTPEQMSALKFTCGRDFGRVCKGVPAGGSDALACLQRNAARLSPNCKTSLADVAESLPAGGMPATPAAAAPAAPPPASAGPIDAAVMVRACKLDLVRYCRNAELGDGRKIACLNEHMANLTVRCRMALKVTAPLR